MRNKKKNKIQDKTALRREETQKRLDAMKTKDGGKKPIRTGSRLGRILFPVTVVVLVLVLITWIVFATGVPQKIAKPLTIGEYKVGTVEYNYYYANNLGQFSSMGLIPQTASGRLDLSQKAAFSEEDETWGDVIARMTRETLQETYMRVDQAKKHNIELNAENQKLIEDAVAKTLEQSGGEVKANNLLVDQYGPGADIHLLKEIMGRALLSTQFAQDYPQSFEISADEIETYYKEHTDDFDTVSFRSYVFRLPQTEEGEEAPSEEKKAELLTELKERAEDMLQQVTDEESFVRLLPDYVPESEQDQYTEEPDRTLQTIKKSGFADTDLRDWMFDGERGTGDKTLLEGSNQTFTIAYFISRQQNEVHLPTVHHILFEADRETASDEEKAAARAQAEETLKKISSAEDMETIGNQLVEAGEAKESNRFEDVTYGRMVEEFNDWIFDPERESGDTAVVETKFGYHVMYFEHFAEDPVWYQDVDKELREQQFQKEMDELKASDDYKESEDSFGMKYVKEY
jgi:hypothetical protein